MTARAEKRGFAKRSADPEQWIKTAEIPPCASEATAYSARLTIDVTP